MRTYKLGRERFIELFGEPLNERKDTGREKESLQFDCPVCGGRFLYTSHEDWHCHDTGSWGRLLDDGTLLCTHSGFVKDPGDPNSKNTISFDEHVFWKPKKPLPPNNPVWGDEGCKCVDIHEADCKHRWER